MNEQCYFMAIPRSIFPRIPYPVIMKLGVPLDQLHIDFIMLAMMGATLDDVYQHYDDIFSEEYSSIEEICDMLMYLVDGYGEFFSYWSLITFGRPWFFVDNLDTVEIMGRTSDNYFLKIVLIEQDGWPVHG